MTLPKQQDVPSKSWIHRHLTGYMIAVYVADLALFGLWYSLSYYPQPVANFELLLKDALIIVNITPPLVMFARWVNSKCIGPLWPVKFTAIVGIAGAYLLLFAMMGEWQSDTISVATQRSDPSKIYLPVTVNSTKDDIIQAMGDSGYFQVLRDWRSDDYSKAWADPINYLKSHPDLYTRYPGYFSEIPVTEEHAKAMQDSLNFKNALYNGSRIVGANGFVFLIGGVIGSLGMAIAISWKERRWIWS